MWEQVVLKRGPHISKVKSELSVQLRPSQIISLSLLSVNDNKVETVRLAMVISIKRHNSLILSIRSWWNLLFAPFFVRSPPSSSPYSSCKADRALRSHTLKLVIKREGVSLFNLCGVISSFSQVPVKYFKHILFKTGSWLPQCWKN